MTTVRSASIVAATLLLFACEETRARPDASVGSVEASGSDTPAPPRPEGCLRNGPLEGIENDPACVLTRPPDDAMREFGKRVTVDVELDPTTVLAGSAASIRVSFTNVSDAETLIVFDARARPRGPRPDWSRLAGVPEVKGEPPDSLPRLQLTVTTLDTHEHPVDALPSVADAAAAIPASRILGVRLRPGAKAMQTVGWWALFIPRPAPIFKDDAGHRFVPKTTAFPLWPGEYILAVDLPLYGLAPQERTFTVRAHVEKPPKPSRDAGR